MNFRYLLYKREEFSGNGEFLLEIKRLNGMLRRHGVEVISVNEESIGQYLRQNRIPPDDVLVLAATDKTLEELQGLNAASIGCLNEDFPKEKLYQADILVEGFEEVDFYFLERIYQRKHDIPWRVIDTERCYLREITVEDLDELYEIYKEPAMTKYMEGLFEREEEEEYTKAYIAGMYRFYGYGMWLVKDRFTDELLGRAGLNNLEIDGEAVLEMGYAIKVSCQRMGYATEVCEGIIDYARGAGLGYDKLHCFVREGNEASVALLKKLGFAFCKHIYRDGRKMPVYVLDLRNV